jgi:hypothetical protein
LQEKVETSCLKGIKQVFLAKQTRFSFLEYKGLESHDVDVVTVEIDALFIDGLDNLVWLFTEVGCTVQYCVLTGNLVCLRRSLFCHIQAKEVNQAVKANASVSDHPVSD